MCASVNLFLLITSQVSAELWVHFTAMLTLGRLLILNERQEHSLIQWDLLICWIPHVFHHVAQMHNYPLELGGTSSLSSSPQVTSSGGCSADVVVSPRLVSPDWGLLGAGRAVYSFYCTVCTTAAGRAAAVCTAAPTTTTVGQMAGGWSRPGNRVLALATISQSAVSQGTVIPHRCCPPPRLLQWLMSAACRMSQAPDILIG